MTALPKLTAAMFGKKLSNDTPILVLLGGFPDDHSLWVNQIEEFKATHHIISIATPFFDDKLSYEGGVQSPLPSSHERGFTPEETAQMISECIGRVIPDDRKFNLISHDWGAYWAYLIAPRLKGRIIKMVVLDVGASVDQTQPRGAFWSMPYQLSYGILFWIGVKISPNLSQFLMSVFDLVRGPFGGMLGPLGWKFRYATDAPRPDKEIKWWMMYPYYQIWFGHILAGRMPPEPKFPTVPILYMYGKNKRAHFHTENFLKKLEDTNGCRYVGLDCNHFVQHEMPDEVNKEMKAFLL